MVLDHNTEIMI